jgi:hypothetical protein
MKSNKSTKKTKNLDVFKEQSIPTQHAKTIIGGDSSGSGQYTISVSKKSRG